MMDEAQAFATAGQSGYWMVANWAAMTEVKTGAPAETAWAAETAATKGDE